MQTGRYYKVHNELGREVTVNKDGSLLTRFKPGISGYARVENRDVEDGHNSISKRYENWIDRQLPMKSKEGRSEKFTTVDWRRKENTS